MAADSYKTFVDMCNRLDIQPMPEMLWRSGTHSAPKMKNLCTATPRKKDSVNPAPKS